MWEAINVVAKQSTRRARAKGRSTFAARIKKTPKVM
jgi:hypothetical protein